MTKHILNLNGQTVEVSGKKLAKIALTTITITLALLAWVGFVFYLMATALAAQEGISAWIVGPVLLVLLGHLTVNGQSRRLLPAWLQQGVGAGLLCWTAVHLHQEGGWAAWQTFLLLVPLFTYIAKQYLKPSA